MAHRHKENGELFGIGLNNNGELGLGDKNYRSEWTKVSAFDGMDIRQIQCGNYQSAVLTDRGLFVMGFEMVDGEPEREGMRLMLR